MVCRMTGRTTAHTRKEPQSEDGQTVSRRCRVKTTGSGQEEWSPVEDRCTKTSNMAASQGQGPLDDGGQYELYKEGTTPQWRLAVERRTAEG